MPSGWHCKPNKTNMYIPGIGTFHPWLNFIHSLGTAHTAILSCKQSSCPAPKAKWIQCIPLVKVLFFAALFLLPTLTWLILQLSVQVVSMRSLMTPPTRRHAGGVLPVVAHLFSSLLEGATHVCGRVRGYQFGVTEPFLGGNIDNHYADGVLITSGSPRRHLWTYAVGQSETHAHACPCSTGGSSSRPNIPAFVGTNYYCESGFVTTRQYRTAWEDPLWDGTGCVTPGNTCCRRHGWFHKQVQQTSDSIEVRWCADGRRSDKDVFTDIGDLGAVECRKYNITRLCLI